MGFESMTNRGSPPHTRGIPDLPDAGGSVTGFTPAYAGNTSAMSQGQCGTRVHPRIRGEYSGFLLMRSTGRGSPPHTRGIHIIDVTLNVATRFTPAYAGNTISCMAVTQLPRVHPRIRGEYKKAVFLQPRHTGSPPHTRGIPASGAVSSPPSRFTPAYAGNTLSPYRYPQKTGVHPRIRGEYSLPP